MCIRDRINPLETNKMTIKSCFSLIEEAKQKIKSINFKNALKLYNEGETIFIDLRDIRELEKSGKIKNAKHVPRGMLEFWIDPKSPYHRDYFNSENKFIFYCASGWRSSLSSKTALEMGLINVLNLENGIDDWIKQNGPIEKISVKKN